MQTNNYLTKQRNKVFFFLLFECSQRKKEKYRQVKTKKTSEAQIAKSHFKNNTQAD
jgi:hypothetical protein